MEVDTSQNCDRSPESSIHALWECESIQAVWTLHFRWVDKARTSGLSFEELIRFIQQKPQATESFATTAWYIWCQRNKLRVNEPVVLNRVAGEAHQHLITYQSRQPRPARPVERRDIKWKPPLPGMYKRVILTVQCLKNRVR